MNQSNTERIMRLVITPLQEVYGKYSDGISKLMVEELAPFSDNILKEAARKAMRENKFQPKIAHMIEACKSILPPRESGKEAKDQGLRVHCRYHAEKMHPFQVKQVLESYEGQEALRLGCGAELLTEYEKTGRMQFDMDFVNKVHGAVKKAAEAVTEAIKVENPAANEFSRWFQAMMDREKRLYARFYKAAA